MVHHVQEVAAALHVRAAVVPRVPVVAVRHVQAAAALRALRVLVAQAGDLLVLVELVVVLHAQAAVVLRAIVVARVVVAIVAGHAVDRVAALRSAVLSRLQRKMIFSRKRKPSSSKV